MGDKGRLHTWRRGETHAGGKWEEERRLCGKQGGMKEENRVEYEGVEVEEEEAVVEEEWRKLFGYEVDWTEDERMLTDGLS